MKLTVDSLIKEAKIFCEIENSKTHPQLYKISDGKAIGTYIEQKFKEYLKESYVFNEGSLANGIDFPDEDINTDLKVTSDRKPQSSCPFKSIEQKIYGLGYNLLILIYEKKDENNTCKLYFKSCQFIESSKTGDYNITKNIIQMLDNNWDKETIINYLKKCNMPADDETIANLAAKIMNKPPKQGYLTISNALQWRLKYNHIHHMRESNTIKNTQTDVKKEYGDYQTPHVFAKKILEYLFENYDINPDVIIEPTCGIGNLIKASQEYYPKIPIIGIDINNRYLQKVDQEVNNVKLYNENIFDFDFNKIKKENYTEYLIIGNPPWITNTRLSKLESDNVPLKNNFKNYDYFESQMGTSNFDVSEYIILHLIDEFKKYKTTIAMLCKYGVACNIFEHLNKTGTKIEDINIIKFNARKIFNADTSSCILIIKLGQNDKIINRCPVYNLDDVDNTYDIGMINGKFYSKIDNTPNIDGKCIFEWRQGIKHDCVKIMELEKIGDKYQNKKSDTLELEEELLYPLLKSSDLKDAIITDSKKKIIITQHRLKENTIYIKKDYPLTWNYLTKNNEYFEDRKSNIYKNAPPYSIFGVGDYTFKKYKVAISGFVKKGLFCLVYNEKSMMLDDTCYYLSFEDYDEAYITMLILNSSIVRRFLKNIVFLESKRPYTKKVLKRIDIQKTLKIITFNDLLECERRLKLDSYLTRKKFEEYVEKFKE